MRIRNSNIALIYLRRSNSRNEISLEAQLDWALSEASRRRLHVDATQEDLTHMIRNRLSSYKSLRIDDGISGADMARPGFQAVLRDVAQDRKISHVLVYRRDRLARPEDAMQMAMIERNIRAEGVTFVFNNGMAEPLDASQPDLTEQLKLLVEYYFNGEDLRKLAERILDAQRLLALGGYSTGGDAPYGFVRVLVDANGKEVEELLPGRRVRQAGCHVRWKPKDQNKIMTWILILDLKHKGWGAKRIARHLNELGIPSPGIGRMRTDQGVRHHVSGKWCGRTVLELCKNSTILGIKEYGNRSEGHHRRLGADGPRTLTCADRNQNNRPKLVQNDPALVARAATGEKPLYDPAKWQEIQQLTAERGKHQRGIPRSADPAKYPLACRVVDLTDRCGSIMYGNTSGKRRLYTCGRYLGTSAAECNNNAVDAEALLRLTLLMLRQQLYSSGQLDQLRQLLEERAKADVPVTCSRDQEIDCLTKRVSQLRADRQTMGRRMAIERDDERYQMIAAEFDRVAAELRSAENYLTGLERRVAHAATTAEQVEAAMNLVADLIRVAEDPNARAEIRPLLEKLRLWIGLDFAWAIKGKKRKVRRLTGGMIVFGDENLPVPLHGKDRCPLDDEGHPPKNPVLTPAKRQVHNCLESTCSGQSKRQDEGKQFPPSSLPELINSHPEGISFTKVSRGDKI